MAMNRVDVVELIVDLVDVDLDVDLVDVDLDVDRPSVRPSIRPTDFFRTFFKILKSRFDALNGLYRPE